MSKAGLTGVAGDAAPTEMLPDEELLARVLSGDLEAYADIMRRHNQRLFRVARSFVTDDAGAMDVLQESYIAAYQRLRELEEPPALGAWLARIVRNNALMHLRKNRRYRHMDDFEMEKVLHLAHPPQQQAQPDREIANAQLRQVLERCIDELPPDFRAVFMLRAVENCSVNAVAEILDLKEATVKTRFHRARMLLQKRLLEYSDSNRIPIHEFAGQRCAAMVHEVMRKLRHMQG